MYTYNIHIHAAATLKCSNVFASDTRKSLESHMRINPMILPRPGRTKKIPKVGSMVMSYISNIIYKFSKVSWLLNLLYELTVELTFEKCY